MRYSACLVQDLKKTIVYGPDGQKMFLTGAARGDVMKAITAQSLGMQLFNVLGRPCDYCVMRLQSTPRKQCHYEGYCVSEGFCASAVIPGSVSPNLLWMLATSMHGEHVSSTLATDAHLHFVNRSSVNTSVDQYSAG